MRIWGLLALLLAFFLFASPCMADSDAFLMDLAEDTWNYLSSGWATSNDMPWSWRSSQIGGGDYVNPTEIGFYMLSWIGAYELGETWSPSWVEVETELNSILDRLEIWQSDLQPTHGPHAYNQSVFYRSYWIGWNPPRVGAGSYDHEVPSIDNAWLAASLITIEEYAKAHGKAGLQNKAHNILKDMNFSFWYHPDVHMFTWGDTNDPQGGGYCDHYSNENRIINFIARVFGDLDETEFKESLNALETKSASYDSITVDRVNWDGSYFTYTSLALFIREMETSYGSDTINRATEAQIQYAGDQGYPVWGISDCYDRLGGGYVQRGAPPRGSGSSSTDPDTGLITPHASAMALITSYSNEAGQNLELLNSYPGVYDNSYGFLDSIDINTNESSWRFSALAQEFIFLSLMNYFNQTIWNYFYNNGNVTTTHDEMANWTPPEYKGVLTVCKSGACDYNNIQEAVTDADLQYLVNVTDNGVYQETVEFGGFNGKQNVTLDCNGATILGNGSAGTYGIYISKGSYCVIKNCMFRNFNWGFYNWDGWGHILINNTFVNNTNGIYSNNGDGFRIIGNNASYNDQGIYLYWYPHMHLIEGNVMEYNENNGLALSYNPYDNTIRNNLARGNSRGFSSTGSNNYTGNTAINNTRGFSVSSGLLENNRATGNFYGFYISGHRTTISENTAEYSVSSGIHIQGSHNNTIDRNNVSYNGQGITVNGGDNNVTDNSIMGNNATGISISIWNGNLLRGCTIAGNIFGLGVTSANNSIYNNIFNNTKNIFKAENENHWNTTKMVGVNIVGGMFLGGNFWAYPNGTGPSETCLDSNNDGICDSSFSIADRNTDFLPLKAGVLAGDVNGDCVVNIFDLAAVGLAYGSSPGDLNWNPNADLNQDGAVNIFDLAIVGLNYGRTC